MQDSTDKKFFFRMAAFLFVSTAVAAAGCDARKESIEVFRKPDAGPPMPGLPDGAAPTPVEPFKMDAAPAPVCKGAPKPEICNGEDDDCNGAVDDVPAELVQSNVLTCGSCTTTCLPRPNVDQKCAIGICEYPCKAGYKDVNTDIANAMGDGCECGPMGVEICDGKDNDCDGVVDNGFDLKANASHCGKCGQKCAVPGAEGACVDSKCTIGSCLPGQFDRNKDPADGCESTCGETNAGVEICDGLDNDCDGKIDELISMTDRSMDDRTVFVADLSLTIFSHEASRPGATAMAFGTRSGGAPCSLPNKLPWANVTKEEATMACAALGGAWRLCTKEEWSNVCSKRNANAFPYGAKYEPSRCNGADLNPTKPGVIPTGQAAMCSTGTTADDGVFDMSGNVREWVVSKAGTEEYELRGGAYNIASFDMDAPGLKCAAAIPAPTASVRLPSVGFRCCHPGPLPQ